MAISKFHSSLLVVSGFIGVIVGGEILLSPVAFYATSGIDLGGNINLLNEVRAPGGALLACGILIILGAFKSKLTYTATLLSTLLYLSYGCSRIVSMLVDGMPDGILVLVAVLEIVIGLICAIALFNIGKQESLHK